MKKAPNSNMTHSVSLDRLPKLGRVGGGAPPLAGTRVALPVVLEGTMKDPTDPTPLSAGSGATDFTADPKPL